MNPYGNPMGSYGIQENLKESKGTVGNPKESKSILTGINWNPEESLNPRESYGIQRTLRNHIESQRILMGILWNPYGIL